MRWLPCSAAPLLGKRLPLSDSTAVSLIEVILADDQQVRIKRLAEMLRLDPAAVLWGHCHLRHRREGKPPTLEDLAVDLNERLPELLVFNTGGLDTGDLNMGGLDTGDLDTGDLDTGDGASAIKAKKFRRLAKDSVQAATRAEQLARRLHDADTADRAYFVGLLHNVSAWLPNDSNEVGSESSTSAVPTADEILKKLDRYLGPFQGWGRIEAESVAAALNSESAADVVETETLAVERWWRKENPLACQLPLLAARLLRLKQLEGKFQETLEDEKLQAMYTLAAGAGHEINNPLGSIAGRAQLLLQDETDPDRRRTLAKINSQAFRAHEMISDMMLFARPPAPVLQTLNAAELIDNVIAEMHEMSRQRDTEIVKNDTASSAMIQADPTQLTVALRAMCMNSLEAIGHGGRIEMSARRLSESAAADVEIAVSDNGPGLAPEQHRHLFDPFYSGRDAGRGLGFGLSKCWRIIRNHGGAIDLESTPGHGATFRIRLPAA